MIYFSLHCSSITWGGDEDSTGEYQDLLAGLRSGILEGEAPGRDENGVSQPFQEKSPSWIEEMERMKSLPYSELKKIYEDNLNKAIFMAEIWAGDSRNARADLCCARLYRKADVFCQ